MKKLYVLDTNVFLQDPQALFAFPDETIVIPLAVIEELDKMKKRQDEIGKNAREVLRKLDKLKKRGQFDGKQVQLNNKGYVIIELNHTDLLKDKVSSEKMDNRILSVAYYYDGLKEDQDQKSKLMEGEDKAKKMYNVILKSNDNALRIKAHAFGITAEEYTGVSISKIDEMYSGYKKITEGEDSSKIKLNPNEYLITLDKDDEDMAIEKQRFDGEKLVERNNLGDLWGISPRNIEQELALDLLLNPDIPLVTLTGKAGTGKTLLALAAGLSQTLDNDIYTKMIVARPIIPMGKDLGYLPGSLEEKMSPWMQPIFDNLQFMLSKDGKDASARQKVQSLIEQAKIEIEALTYIRGRSIPHQYIIIDEAQNLTLHEVKTILTRIGEGSKVVLCGDPDQIDNVFIDGLSNGLSQIIEKLKEEKLHGHIKLISGERSPLAELVSNKV